MNCGDYARLLWANRFQISPQRWPMFVAVGGCTMVNSVLAAWQRWRFHSAIAAQAIDPAPIFVVGHWRSGTTLLHELLALDENFGYPTTLECFLPNHFLVSESLFRPLLRWVLPAKRPMDDMPTGVDLPQEDEFALVAMGAPSPYQRIAFPNHPQPFRDLLHMQDLPASIEKEFAEHLEWFLRSLMLKKQKRLILKSPTHTGRIGWLAKQFPGSRFIHISRHPVEVFLSTKRLWQRLDAVQGFQVPRYSDAELEAMIHSDYQAMYRGYFAGRDTLGPDRLIEIQFEEVITDAAAVTRRIYEQLELGDSSQIEQRVGENMNSRRSHKTARYQCPTETESEVLRQWSRYAAAFGYNVPSDELQEQTDQAMLPESGLTSGQTGSRPA